MILWSFGGRVAPSYICRLRIIEAKRSEYRLRCLVKALCIIYALIPNKVEQQLHTVGDTEV